MIGVLATLFKTTFRIMHIYVRTTLLNRGVRNDFTSNVAGNWERIGPRFYLYCKSYDKGH